MPILLIAYLVALTALACYAGVIAYRMAREL